MTNSNNSYRKCVILFNETQPEAVKGKLKSLLILQDNIEAADFDEKSLRVSYSFPGASISMVLELVGTILDKPDFQAVNSMSNKIRAFVEQNELDYMNYSFGWHRYLEDIYTKYFDDSLNERLDIGKQTWRKYK